MFAKSATLEQKIKTQLAGLNYDEAGVTQK
jgi:hypothetical protein